MRLFLLACTLALQVPKPPAQDRQRILVIEKEPSQAVEQLLREPKLNEELAKRYGLLTVTTDQLEMLVSQELWNPASIRLATLLMRALASSSASGAPVTIGDLPVACRAPLLNALNRKVQSGKAPLFTPSTPIQFRFDSIVTVSDGKSTRSFSAVQEPERKNGTPRTAEKPGEESVATPPPVAKRALTIRFPAPVPDRRYWDTVRAAFKVLEERRQKLEEEFQKEADEITRRGFPSQELNSLKVGDSLDPLPPELYKRQIRRGNPNQEKEFLEKARVTNVQRSLVLVFRFGKSEFDFSPRAIFDAP